jgi:hypothetical protein
MEAEPKEPRVSYAAEIFRSYGFPLIMFACAIVPGANFTFSGHGGLSWFIVPLCFPAVTIRALVKMLRGNDESRIWYRSFYKITIPAYLAIAYPLSCAAVSSLQGTFGLSVSVWVFFGIMVSPFPWWYFSA